jgi:hypothetical protein
MRGRDQGRGRMGRARAPGARGLGRVGLGWTAPWVKTHDTHNHISEFNSRSKIRNKTKQHMRLNTTSDKRKYDSA